jgi:hypothetical protein
MLGDEGESHGCSLAKKTVAFFKISRSKRSRRFSSRSLWFSAFQASESVGQVVEPLTTGAYRLIHERMDAGSTPRL